MFKNYSLTFALIGTASAITREPLLTWKPTNKKSLVMLDREPLMSWKPTVAHTHPMDYPVPNFGQDSDMIGTNQHIQEAEGQYKHNWQPKQDEETEKWIVPHATVEFKLNDDAPVSAFGYAQT